MTTIRISLAALQHVLGGEATQQILNALTSGPVRAVQRGNGRYELPLSVPVIAPVAQGMHAAAEGMDKGGEYTAEKAEHAVRPHIEHAVRPHILAQAQLHLIPDAGKKQLRYVLAAPAAADASAVSAPTGTADALVLAAGTLDTGGKGAPEALAAARYLDLTYSYANGALEICTLENGTHRAAALPHDAVMIDRAALEELVQKYSPPRAGEQKREQKKKSGAQDMHDTHEMLRELRAARAALAKKEKRISRLEQALAALQQREQKEQRESGDMREKPRQKAGQSGTPQQEDTPRQKAGQSGTPRQEGTPRRKGMSNRDEKAYVHGCAQSLMRKLVAENRYHADDTVIIRSSEGAEGLHREAGYALEARVNFYQLGDEVYCFAVRKSSERQMVYSSYQENAKREEYRELLAALCPDAPRTPNTPPYLLSAVPVAAALLFQLLSLGSGCTKKSSVIADRFGFTEEQVEEGIEQGYFQLLRKITKKWKKGTGISRESINRTMAHVYLHWYQNRKELYKEMIV